MNDDLLHQWQSWAGVVRSRMSGFRCLPRQRPAMALRASRRWPRPPSDSRLRPRPTSTPPQAGQLKVPPKRRSNSASFCENSSPRRDCRGGQASAPAAPRGRSPRAPALPRRWARRASTSSAGSAWPRPGAASRIRSVGCSACGPIRCANLPRRLRCACSSALLQQRAPRRRASCMTPGSIVLRTDTHAWLAHSAAFCDAQAELVNASSLWRKRGAGGASNNGRSCSIYPRAANSTPWSGDSNRSSSSCRPQG